MTTPKLTRVTATNICSKGEKISNATIFFQPRLTNGRPIGFRIGGGGQEGFELFEAEVNEGAFAIDLPDTSQTSPLNICYAVTVRDKSSGRLLFGGPGSGYEQYQPSGDDDNFDDFVPNLAPQISVQTGPPGEDGKDAYDLAVENGFEGDEEAWLASLHGADGAQGPQGETGATGVQGPKGDKGDTGTPATPNTASSPLVITDNNISIPKATASQAGYLASADFTAFASKLSASTGTSGHVLPYLDTLNLFSATQIFAQIQATALGNTSDVNNAWILPQTTGTLILRNKADANTALTVNQLNGSSTGKILSLQFASVEKASFDKDGNLAAPNTRSIYTGSGSLTGSTLTPGSQDFISISVPGAIVGAAVIVNLADGTDTSEGGNVLVYGNCATAGLINLHRIRASYFTTNYTTTTKTYNVRVIN